MWLKNNADLVRPEFNFREPGSQEGDPVPALDALALKTRVITQYHDAEWDRISSGDRVPFLTASSLERYQSRTLL